VDGEAWEWDGVRFEMLHPDAAGLRLAGGEEQRHELRAEGDGGAGSALLTGDIEALSEQALSRGMARAARGRAAGAAPRQPHLVVALNSSRRWARR
jgi:competence protein ComEC